MAFPSADFASTIPIEASTQLLFLMARLIAAAVAAPKVER